MRLEKIKLAGFKSFVDPTTLVLPGRLIGIVGPNGCGKSNLIDAVRFVIGESSARHLRGSAMSDVIFNGSASRTPVSLASVELIFDNGDGRAGGEFARYAQISVKRQVTREGQSQYFLNGSRCRRRDIMDLFLGTGLGPRSYAIIEQGMVSRFIEARPEELRLFIEEAAGLSKYKERRRETEIKLEHTRANLERVADIRRELQGQVNRLARQARKAEKFRELEREIVRHRHQLLAMQWREADDAYRCRQAELNDLERRLKAEEAQCQLARKAAAQARREVEDLEKQLQRHQADLYRIDADISRCDQALRHAEQSRRQRRQRLEEWRQELERTRATLAQDQEQLAELKAQRNRLEAELAEAKRRAEDDRQAQRQRENQWRQARKRHGQCLDRLRRLKEALRLTQVEIQHREQRRDEIQRRLEGLAAQKNDLAAQIQALDTRSTETELEGLGDRYRAVQDRLQRLEESRRRLQQEIHQHQERQQQLAGRIHRLEGQIGGLETLQRHALGKDRQRLEEWLAQRGWQSLPRLAETLVVEPGWERAVETALDRWLQALCLPDLPAEVEAAPESIAVVCDASPDHLPPDSLAGKVPPGHPAVALLLPYRCSDALAAALSRRGELEPHQRWITPAGDQVGPNGVFVNRDRSEEPGILERQTLLREYRDQLQSCRHQETQLRRSLEQLAARLADVNAQGERLRAEERELGTARIRLQAALQSARQRRREMEERLSGLEREQQAAAARFGHLAKEIDRMNQRREQTRQETETLQAELRRLNDELERTGSVHEQATRQAHRSREKVLRLEAALEHTESALSLLHNQVQRTERQCRELESRIRQTQGEQERDDEPIERYRQELEELLRQRPLLEERLATVRTRLQEAVERLREQEGLSQHRETARDRAREALEQARLQAEAARVRFESVQEQIRTAGVDLARTLESLPEEGEPESWHQRLARLEKEQARLGDVNFAAIEEHRLHSERLRFLDKQCHDLENALALLEKAIRTIDRETRTRFRETFTAVDGHFRRRFPALFGGGEARLELTSDDPLEAGVRIVARPPGKRNSSIHLLSGGEKALTAIALVFSFFELNPAPFCILDEVDAPLDDANVGRYCRLLQSMAERVQFLFVTHNKITMEIADQLIGVTMREPGVSRIVAVDLQQAAEMAA